MRSRRMFAVGAVIVAMGLVGTACAAPDANDDSSSNKKTSLNVGWNQPFYSYNEFTNAGNATANANIKYLMNENFWYYTPDSELKPNTSFGTYEKTSDDPLTVKYTVADDAKWSDGTPVDAADLLLTWAAQSNQLNTITSDKAKISEDTGQPTNAKGQVFFNFSSPGLELVKDTPKISDDGKSLTLVYSKKFADWNTDMTVNLPAHIVAEKALGISDPTKAKDAFIKAVDENDKDALLKISNFYNTGFDYSKMPEDKDLALSDGAYLMKEFKENEYMTLVKNPDFKGDHKASIDEVTVRWNEDPLAQVQALENGELDMFLPQVTSDVVKAAEKIDGVKIQKGLDSTYEHIDLKFNNGGPFDPAAYGGDAKKALLVRQAFLSGVPRQEIVDKLIKPITPEAEVRNSFLRTPGFPGYDEIVAQNGISTEYAAADPTKSKQLLKQAGITKPVDVRLLYAKGNQRRENEFQLMQPALKAAGFNLINKADPDWGKKLRAKGFDAQFFGWQATTTGVSSDQAIYATGGSNNNIGYSNPEVDKLFSQLVLTEDQAEQVKLQTQIDKLMIKDAIGLTIFQFPAATFVQSKRVTGVDSAQLSPTLFYGFWNWKVPSN